MLVRRSSEKLRTLESDTVSEAFLLLTSAFWLLGPLPVWFRLCRVRLVRVHICGSRLTRPSGSKRRLKRGRLATTTAQATGRNVPKPDLMHRLSSPRESRS